MANEFTIEDKVRDFTDLLEQIDNVSDKKKKLWREIYENAVTDRQNAYLLFTQLLTITGDKSTEHAIHGKSLATYIERMSRANDQIIRLAELVAKSEGVGTEIDAEEMYKKLSEK